MDDKAAGSILCFGEVLLRLSAPVGRRLINSSSLDVHVGGAEANVAAALGQLGHDVEMLSVLPRSGLGDLCVGELRRGGVGTARVRRSDQRMGVYFFEAAPGAGSVQYDREQSAFAGDADQFDWAALASEARWFHLSGINLALGGKPADAARAASEAMAAAGVPVSFDVNHRAALWERRSDEGVVPLIAAATTLFASPQDICRLLRTAFADGAAAGQGALERFERLEVVAWTCRSNDGDRQSLSASVVTRSERHETAPAPLGQVVDRIGSGDAFAGAVIDGLLRGQTAAECAKQGLAAAIMKHAIAGDRWIGTRAELDAFDPFNAGDLRR
jgi:2-dehydro-3-deoxygluconokinase